MSASCVYCDSNIPDKRVKLGYITCMTCGDREARAVVRTVVPMHKSNYFLCTNLEDLKGINNKGGNVR